jgi:hypothetical protein
VEAVARYAARRPMPAAVVAGAATPSALAAIRSLARAGAPVLALDHRRSALGGRSRQALSVRGPDPSAPAGELVSLLLELARALPQRPVVVPTEPAYVLALDAERDRLDGQLCPAFPPVAAVEALTAEPDGGRRISAGACVAADGELLAGAPAGGAAACLGGDGLHGLVWGEVEQAGEIYRPVRVEAGLWPGWERSGVDFPRVAYWGALGAQLPAAFTRAQPARPWVGRAPVLRRLAVGWERHP